MGAEPWKLNPLEFLLTDTKKGPSFSYAVLTSLRLPTIRAEAHSTALTIVLIQEKDFCLEIYHRLPVDRVGSLIALSPVTMAHSLIAQRSIHIGSAVISSVNSSEWHTIRSPAFRSRSGMILLP